MSIQPNKRHQQTIYNLWKTTVISIVFSIIGLFSISTLASEAIKIAIIVHSSNSQSNINIEELSKILSGEQQHWHNGKKILLINRPEVSSIHQMLCQHLKTGLNAAPDHRCHNTLHNTQFTQSTDQAASQFVARFSNALSFVSHQQLEQLNQSSYSIKALTIDGIDLMDSHYPLSFADF